ncbi:MAG: anthranilate synthase component I [Pseudomonadales bacterium]|nr:anthranilate synthase component I [Pseudomonadales bacterium]NIX09734.1 anthranilate synthase component I [Pseudomonadales bacterium]
MNQAQFAALAEAGYNRIPVVFETLADLDTPLSTYLKLARGPYSYLLESAHGGEKWGRYSIIGLPCQTVLKVGGNRITVETNGELVETLESPDPLSFIEAFQARYRVAELPELPRFYGGLVGYFGYDTVRYAERRLADGAPPDPLGTPDIVLMVSEEVVVFDNLRGRMQLISLVDPAEPDVYQRTMERLRDRARTLSEPVPPIPESATNQPVLESDFTSEFGEEPFKESVERIREYIRAGDVMQVVLAQRMSLPFGADAIDLYRALRSLNPSPYMYFMDLDEFQIVSSSPEILARLEDGKIINRPLAGTRRRGHTPEEDLALEQELLSDPKELAEHLMLIDLGRNDVGRVAEIGSVEVTEQFVIERYSHVMHISSNVVGQLAEGKSAIDVLRATLPVGTLSGAPKIRAMEIIDELEPVKRGIYGGAVGYLAWNGNMDTAIAIRTAVIKDGTLYIEAGGGVVADSVPRLEWKESMNKGRAIFRAAAMAENRFTDLD